MSGWFETFRGVVYPWHCDHLNHMNVQHYVGMFDNAFWHQVSALGFTRAYLDASKTGFADVRATFEYRMELPVGSLVVVDSGLLKAGATSIVGYHRMKNSETGDIAATAETVTVYFDLDERRKTPLPEALRPRLEAAIVEKE